MYANDVMTNRPWAYWKFEETNDTLFSSMQAYDYSGHNYDATYGNGDVESMASGCKDGGESLPRFRPDTSRWLFRFSCQQYDGENVSQS